MRKLSILKALLDLFYFFAILSIVFITVLGAMMLFGYSDIPVKIKGQEITVTGWDSKMLLIVVFVSFLLFLYAIYLLRKVIHHFVKREIFYDPVIAYLNTIGLCLIGATLLQNVSLFFYNLLHRNNIGVEFGVGGFDSFLLSIGLGLFFMVLSEVFKIAKNLKEENELTV